MEPAAELESKKEKSLSGLLLAILGGVILLALAALLVGAVKLYTTGMTPAVAFIPVSAMVGAPRSSSTVTRTPFQPQTYTPTPTVTPSPTATSTPTATPIPSSTPTPSATSTPAPTDTPAPPPIPDQASVSGVSGHSQALNLSCESRSAVDWASFFGVSIHELDFQNKLPKSGNPETGFVGNPNGEPGQIPPRSYGVHAGPVATLLRSYGVSAVDYRRIGYDDLRREVAAGRPVIVWVIGDVWSGKGTLYRAPDGSEVTVAHFEHTVILVAYTPDKVTVIDGGLIYSVSVDQFQNSWAALGNQAIFNH